MNIQDIDKGVLGDTLVFLYDACWGQVTDAHSLIQRLKAMKEAMSVASRTFQGTIEGTNPALHSYPGPWTVRPAEETFQVVASNKRVVLFVPRSKNPAEDDAARDRALVFTLLEGVFSDSN